MLVAGMVIVQSQSSKEIVVNRADSSNVVQLECEQIQSGFQSSFKLNHFHNTSGADFQFQISEFFINFFNRFVYFLTLPERDGRSTLSYQQLSSQSCLNFSA